MYISQADKGGAILLLKPHEVHKIITTELQNTNKFKLLKKDPVKEFEQVLKTTMDNWVKKESMTQKERKAITGYSPPFKSKVKKAPQWALTKSLHPAYKIQKPCPVPSFKLHSLSEENISNKVIPPIRFIHSSKFGPTYRLGKWLDSIN